MGSYDIWCLLEYADLVLLYSIMLQWSATKYSALKINTQQTVITITITIKHVVLHLRAKHIWHSSISTIWSSQMSNLTSGLECIAVKIQYIFPVALMPLYPHSHKIDAERQFCLYLCTTTSGGQHRTDVFDISPSKTSNMWRVWYELAHVSRGILDMGCKMWDSRIMTLIWLHLSTHPLLLTCLNAINETNVIASEAHVHAGDK